ELINVIWQGRIVSDATLTSRISAARRALGDSGSDQSLIRTLHKRGFRFVGEVEDSNSAPSTITIAEASPSQGAVVDETARCVSHKALPFCNEVSGAVLPLRTTGSGPDQDRPSENLAPATAALAPDDAASDAAGAEAIVNADHGACPPPRVKGPALHGRRAARNPLFAVAAMGLASLLVCAAWGLLSSPFASPAPHSKNHIVLTSQALASVNRPETPVTSIVVLPFDNLGGDAKRDYLADGI